MEDTKTEINNDSNKDSAFYSDAANYWANVPATGEHFITLFMLEYYLYPNMT